MPNSIDTIVAIATPPGQAAIGVIRLSGPDSLSRIEQFWQGKRLAPRQLTLGWISAGSQKIDQAMAVYMPAPHSYTGDDVVEIQVHGSPLVLNQIIDILTGEQVRLAEPGEFTKRAYLAGKIDFTQAEAVSDIISSEHDAMLRLSTDQLAGGVKNKVAEIKLELAEIAALLTAQLDFSEEDIADLEYSDLARRLSQLQQKLDDLSRGGTAVVQLREGIKVALVGLPNAGKSTLLNSLLGYDRAIVTDVAGTTRDTIEEVIKINGVNYRLVDTAGLNATPEQIEKVGIAKSIEQIKTAQLILLLIEPTKSKATLRYLEQNGLSKYLHPTSTLVVHTKSDLARDKTMKSKYSAIHISVKDTLSLSRLRKKISAMTINQQSLQSVSLTTKRQLDCVSSAGEQLARALKATHNNQPFDLIAADLDATLQSLNELTGEHVSAQVAEALFANFCIGK